MSEWLLVWGVLLVALSLVLLAAEAFIPSGGLISVVAAAVAISGIVCLFKVDWKWGVSGIGTVAVLGPLLFIFALQLMPSTKVGRTLMFGEDGQEHPVLSDDAAHELDVLIGAEGTVLTDLRPIGAVRLGDRRIDALAELSFIPAGSRVKVVSVDGTTIKVRAV
jgi:membrane-bound serine protease (ClpP class)